MIMIVYHFIIRNEIIIGVKSTEKNDLHHLDE